MAQQPMTSAGKLGVAFGALLFGLGAISGGSLIACGLGLLFIAAGWSAREKRLCPACKLEVPAGATVCGHCRAALAAAPPPTVPRTAPTSAPRR